MVQMQAAQASGEMLDKQAQDLAQRAREQKGRQWTREEAQALLEELQESENSLRSDNHRPRKVTTSYFERIAHVPRPTLNSNYSQSRSHS